MGYLRAYIPPALFHPCHDSSGVWKTVAMVCVAVPQTSLVCVTSVGPLICPHPHLPQDPLPHVALGTVAATFTATAAGGDLASVMSARVSHHGPSLMQQPCWVGALLPFQDSGFFLSESPLRLCCHLLPQSLTPVPSLWSGLTLLFWDLPIFPGPGPCLTL